ncbi:hypothetical protein [Brevundimonas sp. GCM10030266]|uniref:hypothetical protein n=1 Tax=Brevundimonas sp. GCM10030266 TaxID=3273386 RepID=UPI00361C3B13
MSAFEFFFSFYGLVLGLSVAVLATGAARAFKHRKTVRVGWKTPLLAIFAAFDIATFWDAAWTNLGKAPYSYGMLLAGLVVAIVYFIAANLIFPEPEDQATSLDSHFEANKKPVLLLLILANILMVALCLTMLAGKPNFGLIASIYAVNFLLYVVLVVPAALSKRAWVFATTIGLHIALYLVLAVLSVTSPQLMAAVPTMDTPATPASTGAD